MRRRIHQLIHQEIPKRAKQFAQCRRCHCHQLRRQSAPSNCQIVVHTIRSISPSCRIYRETADSPIAKSSVGEKDFTNMILFCRKSIERFDSRYPVEADYLGSHARTYQLFPEHEVGWDHFKSENGDADPPEILRRGHTKTLEAFQSDGALGHWSVMRAVLPDAIWENW